MTLYFAVHRDMYCLKAPGFPIEDVKLPHPDPLVVSRYPCVYWIDHLFASKPEFPATKSTNRQILGAIHRFLTQKYLYWLEGLSLCKNVENGIISVAKLWSMV